MITSTKKARFFILLDTERMIKSAEPITFTLPAGSTLPSDLSILMKKVGRFLSLSETSVEAFSDPQCIGEDCSCVICEPSSCKGEFCKDFTTTTETIQCNNSSCSKTNDAKYFIYSFYPDPGMFLSDYNPKFKFLRYIPARKIPKNRIEEIQKKMINEKTYYSTMVKNLTQDIPRNNTSPPIQFPPDWTLAPGYTMPPGYFYPFLGTLSPNNQPPAGWDILPGMVVPPLSINIDNQNDPSLSHNSITIPDEIYAPETAVFALTYPSMTDFNTKEKFLNLYEAVMFPSIGFLMLGEDRYIQHNIAVLQQILKSNNLPKSLLNPQNMVEPKMVKEKTNYSTIFPNDVVIERYEDIDLGSLIIPISSLDDTDDVVETLSTPEPDLYVSEIENKIVSDVLRSISNTTTSVPVMKKSKPKGLSLGKKIGIGAGIAVVVFLISVFVRWYFKNKKSGSKRQRK